MSARLLAAKAVRQAALVRARTNVAIGDALCPFDVTERLGISTRLLKAPSLEGMYSPGPIATIVVGSERPSGRQRFTCSHELGHHEFGHGVCLDDVNHKSGRPEEEFVANQFAAALLMPTVAVNAAFHRRGIAIRDAKPALILEVSQDLGVGFTTLVRHLECSLRMLESAHADRLRRTSLPKLRAEMSGVPLDDELFIVNRAWGVRPLDMQVGDVALVTPGAKYAGIGAVLEQQHPSPHLKALTAGVGYLWIENREQPIVVRVSRRSFEGLARYRFLEECPDDELLH